MDWREWVHSFECNNVERTLGISLILKSFQLIWPSGKLPYISSHFNKNILVSICIQSWTEGKYQDSCDSLRAWIAETQTNKWVVINGLLHFNKQIRRVQIISLFLYANKLDWCIRLRMKNHRICKMSPDFSPSVHVFIVFANDISQFKHFQFQTVLID